MANHRISVRAFDATSTRIAQFALEVSTDNGATWQTQSLVDGKAEFAVSEGQPFSIRASRDGLWEVTQQFVARGAPNFELAAVGALDPGIAHDASICSIQADHLHLIDVYLTLFRDASEDLLAWEKAHRPSEPLRLPVPAHGHGIIDFAGLPVTSSSGPSVLEMAGTERWTNNMGAGLGQCGVDFLRRPSRAPLVPLNGLRRMKVSLSFPRPIGLRPSLMRDALSRRPSMGKP